MMQIEGGILTYRDDTLGFSPVLQNGIRMNVHMSQMAQSWHLIVCWMGQ